MRLTGLSSLVSLTIVLIHELGEGSYGAVPEEQHDQHWHHDPHLELPVDLSPGPPHHYQGQHAQSIEEGGGHHVHVEQLADVPQQDEDDPQTCCEEETWQGGQGELVDVGDDLRQMTFPTGAVNLTEHSKVVSNYFLSDLSPGGEDRGVQGTEGRH